MSEKTTDGKSVPSNVLLALLRKHHDAFRAYASELMASPFDVVRVASVAATLDDLCNEMTDDINANKVFEQDC